MTSPAFDLCAIGNALIDMTFTCDDAFLAAHKIDKAVVTLVDDVRSDDLYERAAPTVETASGGSAANTMVGFASLGGKGAFIGKVGRDKMGEMFAHDIRASGLHFPPAYSSDLPTGRVLVFVTPDAQRSMLAYLGAGATVGAGDVDADAVKNSAITYLEGYAFNTPQTMQAFRFAADVAHQAGRQLALTLSDAFCVNRHRAEFRQFIEAGVDILFANELELKALYQTEDLQSAIAAVRAHVGIAVTTRSEKGAIIVKGEDVADVPAHPCGKVVDTTGAGDLYAAGFLYGVTRGLDIREAGRIGSIAAGEVISHYGPRPLVNLSKMISLISNTDNPA